MYENWEATLARILELTAKCPKEYQEKCFEGLLSGYVQREVAGRKAAAPGAPAHPPPADESHIPPSVLPRFKNTAKRLGVALEKLESLFDFTRDPFGLHAVTVPGTSKGEKTRNVALLAASRSYLAMGSWTADWQEVKSLCIDHNCYDQTNHAVLLKRGAGTLFKAVDAGKAIDLSSDGIKRAEEMLKGLAEGTTK